MGDTERNIINQAIRMRQPIPEKILNAPELIWGLDLFYLAFLDVSTCRVGGDGPIIWSAIIEWCDEYEVRGEQREDVLYHVNHMDRVYLDFQQKKRKPPPGKGNKNGRAQRSFK